MSETMSASNRLVTVAVLYAALGLMLAVSDVLMPTLGLFALWLDSWLMKVAIFVVLWILAPMIGRHFVSDDQDETP
jgi:membrane protein implicated in regulation of membrane protease activity